MQRKKALRVLVDLSREFGSDPRYVIAGGGNSSIKDNGVMYVKGSGSRMGNISDDGFVAMDLEKISAVWKKDYSEKSDEREEEVLADLLAARLAGEENKRPSVETLLHALFSEKLVMHTHPALVNGITCGVSGEKEVASLFGDRVLWIPLVEPGYILAKLVLDAMQKAGSRRKVVFLQNHGVFVAGNTPNEIRETYKNIFSKIEKRLASVPASGTVTVDDSMCLDIAKAFAGVSQSTLTVFPFMDLALEPFLQNKESFSALERPLSPDHIVYAGFFPLFIERLDDLPITLDLYQKEHGELPKIVAIKGRFCFACSASLKSAMDASDLFVDEAKVVGYSRSFGGPLPMTAALVSFIRTWEAEKYRQNKA